MAESMANSERFLTLAKKHSTTWILYWGLALFFLTLINKPVPLNVCSFSFLFFFTATKYFKHNRCTVTRCLKPFSFPPHHTFMPLPLSAQSNRLLTSKWESSKITFNWNMQVQKIWVISLFHTSSPVLFTSQPPSVCLDAYFLTGNNQI